MAKTTGRLTAQQVDSLPPRSTPYADGANLYLDIKATGARSWVFIYRWNGKQRTAGLGTAGGKKRVTLADARDRAKKGREMLDRKPPVDPLTMWRAPAEATVPTFGTALKDYLVLHRPQWKSVEHARQWRATVETYCQSLLETQVDKIDTAAVLKVLTPIWSRIPETANRVRGRIETIINFGKPDDEIRPNPARWRGHLDKKLPKPKEAGKHIKRNGAVVRVERGEMAALPYKDAPSFARRLRAEDGVAARALEFVLLTAARTGEVLSAEWTEVDFSTRLWTRPWEHLKTGRRTKRAHVVPLTDRAVAVLEEMRATASSGFIFPGRFDGQPLGDKALLALLKEQTGRADLTTHGLRSTFRDWVGDCTNFPGELAEHALGHIVRGVEGRYRRGDALDRRREMMDAWSRYCESPPPGDEVAADNVLPFESRSARAV